MVNPGAFLGSRKEFLTAQADLYATAVIENHVADTVADIQCRYFKRYPISLPHNEEPSPEWLAQVDDNAADDELLPPDKNTLEDAAFTAAKAVYDEHVKVLKFRKEQIARHLAYQHGKAHNPPKRIEAGSHDPMAILMSKLAGIPIKKPRLRPAYTVWGQHHRQLVDAIFDDRVKEENVPASQRAALRVRIYKECFDELDAEERKEYETQAADEHRLAIEKIEKALNAPASQDPADRQRILQGLPSFIQPILDLVTEYSGWKATLLVGGPEPADQGRLNIMSFHSGETSGGVKMNFGRAERLGYKNFVMPIFGSFLKKCYTIEDCRAAALPDATAASLADVCRMDGSEFTVDSADSSNSYVRLARTPSGGRDSAMPSTPNPSSTPGTYEIPAKIGPPIHAKKAQTRLPSEGTSLTTNTQVINVEGSLLLDPSIAASASTRPHPPSTPPSPCPSPAISPLASPAPNPQALSPCSLRSTPHASLPASPPPRQLLAQPSSAPQVAGQPPRDSLDRPPHASLPPTPQPLDSPVGSANARKRRLADQGESKRAKAAKMSSTAPARRRLRSNVEPQDAQDGGDGVDSAHVQNTAAALTREELSGAPTWFLDAYQMLVSKDFGPAWMQLVRRWAQFERASGYAEIEKLRTKGRPPCVRDWIARARLTTYRPDVGPLSPFAKSFNIWWRGMQPDWRVQGAGRLLQTPGADLESLRRPGKNGLLSVLAALFFWRFNIDDGAEGGARPNQSWNAAVNDVQWVLQNLI